jgi:hypothetical protein
MSKDGLRRLPDHIVAPLLRALMSIPRRPDARLILKPVEDARPPGFDKSRDYNVVFRGRVIGRVWQYDYRKVASGEVGRMPWHWNWSHVEGRANADGHALTLESALADFRRAWDGDAARAS